MKRIAKRSRRHLLLVESLEQRQLLTEAFEMARPSPDSMVITFPDPAPADFVPPSKPSESWRRGCPLR